MTDITRGADRLRRHRAVANSVDAEQLELTTRDLYLALAKDVPNPDGDGIVANPYANWSDVNPDLSRHAHRGARSPAHVRYARRLRRARHGGRLRGVRGHRGARGRRQGCRLPGDARRTVPTSRPARERQPDRAEALEANADDAVGIFGFSFLDQNSDKVQSSKIDGEAATFDAIASGAYPVSRPALLLRQEPARRYRAGHRGIRRRVHVRAVLGRGRLPRRQGHDPARRGRARRNGLRRAKHGKRSSSTDRAGPPGRRTEGYPPATVPAHDPTPRALRAGASSFRRRRRTRPGPAPPPRPFSRTDRERRCPPPTLLILTLVLAGAALRARAASARSPSPARRAPARCIRCRTHYGMMVALWCALPAIARSSSAGSSSSRWPSRRCSSRRCPEAVLDAGNKRVELYRNEIENLVGKGNLEAIDDPDKRRVAMRLDSLRSIAAGALAVLRPRRRARPGRRSPARRIRPELPRPPRRRAHRAVLSPELRVDRDPDDARHRHVRALRVAALLPAGGVPRVRRRHEVEPADGDPRRPGRLLRRVRGGSAVRRHALDLVHRDDRGRAVRPDVGDLPRRVREHQRPERRQAAPRDPRRHPDRRLRVLRRADRGPPRCAASAARSA